MFTKNKPLTPAQKKSAAFLTRPLSGFEPGWDEERYKGEKLNASHIGKLIPDRGVYFGIWEPRRDDGTSLGKVFNLFAAPKDLSDADGETSTLSFKDAVRRIAELKDWHGQNGGLFENESALRAVLVSGRYAGEWFIPPLELIDGSPVPGEEKKQKDNLFVHQNRGALHGTFVSWQSTNRDGAFFYLSSTEHHGENYPAVYATGFGESVYSWHYSKIKPGLSCRPVRAEPRLLKNTP